MTYRKKLQQRAKKNLQANVAVKHSVYDVIDSHQMTEKAYWKMENGQYIFLVHWDANKNDVKLAVKQIFDVTPQSVNLTIVPQKSRQNRWVVRKAYKKATVTLKNGDKINIE